MTASTENDHIIDDSASFRPLTAVSLNTYIDRHFNSSELEMGKTFGFSSQQIKRWLLNDAVVVENSIYLKKSNFPETDNEIKKHAIALASTPGNPKIDPVCYSLDDHIEMEYGGNQTAFAKINGSTQQQVFRWVNLANCIYLCDQVYRHQLDLVPV